MTEPNGQRAPRYPAETLQLGSPLDATILNLSRTGMAIETRDWAAIGARYPFNIRCRGRVTRVDGTVRWCRLKRTTRTPSGDVIASYEAGIEFVAESRSKLNPVLESLLTHNPVPAFGNSHPGLLIEIQTNPS